MTENDKIFDLCAEFASIDFSDKRLSKRFVNSMNTLFKSPSASINGACSAKAEAKGIYRMLGNDKFDTDLVLAEHRKAVAARMSGMPTVLAVQDTTSVNYATHKKMDGIGYTGNDTLGVSVHSTIAVSTDGVVLGLFAQKAYSRPEAKDSRTKQELKLRPVEEKESARWLEGMDAAESLVPDGTKLIHVCDRECDFFEFFAKADRDGRRILVRVAQDRQTEEGEKILSCMKDKPIAGTETVSVPRDSRRGLKARKAELEIRFATFHVSRPQLLAKLDCVPESVPANIVHVRERNPPEGADPIEWFLLTNLPVRTAEAAMEMVGFYILRWRIERLHYVLKSGCKIEELQERSLAKTNALIFLYSIISVYIMYLAYSARTNPDLLCSAIFDEDEWKVLYCAANKTPKAPDKPYSIAEAVFYIACLAGPRPSPSDGPIGVKRIWIGSQKLEVILDFSKSIGFVGQG
jgi:hypothetical protein